MKILGIPVVYDPACRTLAQARGVWPFFRIVVGREWFALEGEARAAMLLHEVGHCRRHHTVKRIAGLPLLILWVIGAKCGEIVRALAQQQELEADRFAADQGFGLHLAHALSEIKTPESPFYPSNDVRAAILMARHCKEASCKA